MGKALRVGFRCYITGAVAEALDIGRHEARQKVFCDAHVDHTLGSLRTRPLSCPTRTRRQQSNASIRVV